MHPQAVHSADDTIVAQSTPDGRSGIGVIRVSGRRTLEIIARFFHSKDPLEDRRARYGSFGPEPGKPIDRVILTVFKSPHSYTGEDVAEISAHGNPLIINEIIRVLCAAGARRAAPGEFTLRAVVNGKMDLAQAEAVRDFIQAQTDMQARTAMLQMEGALAKRLGPERKELTAIIAQLEAGIDFAEDDVEVPDARAVAKRVMGIVGRLEQHAATFEYGRLLTNGLSLAIVGKPNVGKSSLFNRLVSMDRAIVTAIPGTTRDVVTETAAIGGVPIRFADTAGIRQTAGTVEALGVARTMEVVAEADLALVVLDLSRELDDEDKVVLERVQRRPHIVVLNKRDLPARWDSVDGTGVRVSAKTGAGFGDLEAEIHGYLTKRRPSDSDGFFVTHVRQHETLLASIEKLRSAAAGCRSSVPYEMVLLDLYEALACVGELTGEVVADDILDEIFSTFCIGK